MFRYRRYRVFLVFALIVVFALYRFGSSGTSWREVAAKADGWRNQPQLNWDGSPPAPVAKETKKFEVDIPAAKSQQPLETPPPIPTPIKDTKVQPVPPPPPPKSTPEALPTPNSSPTPAVASEAQDSSNAVPPSPQDQVIEAGEGRVEVTPLPSSIEVIHWQKQSQFFPVPTESLIKVPSGKPKPISKIQFSFKPESAAAKADREAKLNTIRAVFKRSWDGYKQFAWLQDELTPVSGKFKNPFAGWGATLVDSLDTLWIMGMKEEFEEAVKAVDKLDFTTTERADIPLFETTIRYLGGFIAAYDMSGKVHKNLLEKAVELAEILMSAFDTPNRMPQTYYFWRPEFASQKHRASNRVVLAEIGSLSMEFTRLAQLTGEHKYYDAIARITDHLEEYQNNTRLPGMWPTYLDASGCKRAYVDLAPQKPLKPLVDLDESTSAVESDPSPSPSPTEQLSPDGKKYIPLKLPDPVVLSPNGPNPTWQPPKEDFSMLDSLGKGALQRPGNGVKKRQLDLDEPEAPKAVAQASPSEAENPSQPKETPPECIPQGFVTSSEYGSEEYTLGGMSDSTYEYLPKEWLLLGGQIEKYRTMYEQSVDVVKEHLLFRPMLPNEDDILFSGKFYVPSVSDQTKLGDLEGENAHLTCFAGGMFGMGAKLFNRPEDLEIAKKLTEGCIWSYNMTTTGIMPEAFITVPCDSAKDCAWNATKYHETIDPRAESRLETYKEQLSAYKEQYASASAWYEAELAAMTAPATPTVQEAFEAAPTDAPQLSLDSIDKRQLADLEDETPEPSPASSSQEDTKNRVPQGLPTRVKPAANGDNILEKVEVAPPAVPEPSSSRTLPAFPVLYSPKPPLTHKEYVENRILEERLPPGVTQIKARNYILRPEAIESVWYMYRITGEAHWREAGWRMFEAVNTHTTSAYGNSAIDDVTKTAPELDDSMESFWLAETLKYFYLLFADENTVNLDEWVLNTEAHPFRRPS